MVVLLLGLVSYQGREVGYAQTVTPAGCYTYVVTDRSNSSVKFLALDLQNQTVISLPATYSGDTTFESLAVDPITKILYTVAGPGYSSPGRLYRVDAVSGNLTLVGNTTYNNVSALSFKPDGSLWGWDQTKGLISINKNTGVSTLSYSIIRNFGGMTWNLAGNLLYLSLENKELWTYTPSGNVLTRLSTNLPYEGDSLAMRSDGVLLGGNGNGGTGAVTIYSYNTSTKTSANIIGMANAYDDVEDIAWPQWCGNPYSPATPTPTPTRTPSPTPTRSPSPTPTRSPSPTPTRSPSPTPTPTPPLVPACAPNCSLKQIGTINPLFNTFSADGDNSIQMNDSEVWVRLTIQGPAPLASSNVIVRERIDTTNFSIVDPVYTSASNYTFKITKRNGAGETDVTCTDGADGGNTPDCVVKLPASGAVTSLDVTISNFLSTDVYYIYFKVTPLRSLSAAQVDSATSQIEYVGFGATNPNRLVALDMHQVNISNAPPFFQVSYGDVYSGSTDVSQSVESALPTNGLFDTANNSIVTSRGGTDWGNGDVNTHGWEIRDYAQIDDSDYDYNVYAANYARNIVPIDLTAMGYTAITQSGYYIDSAAGGAGYKLTIDNTWNAQNIQGRQIVIFVPGDLQIDKSFTVQKDGQSSIVFLVQGNIGIDPDVTRVEGVYLARGVIDTSCRGSFSLAACPPTSSDPLSIRQLNLEGVFFADDDGFVLDRKPETNIAGEIFTFRADMILNAMTSIGQKKYTWAEYLK